MSDRNPQPAQVNVEVLTLENLPAKITAQLDRVEEKLGCNNDTPKLRLYVDALIATARTPAETTSDLSSGDLTAAMDNVLAWKLGRVALDAADVSQKSGDYIDRGLILLRLLNENGFSLRALAAGRSPVPPRPQKRLMKNQFGPGTHEECPDCRGDCCEPVEGFVAADPAPPPIDDYAFGLGAEEHPIDRLHRLKRKADYEASLADPAPPQGQTPAKDDWLMIAPNGGEIHNYYAPVCDAHQCVRYGTRLRDALNADVSEEIAHAIYDAIEDDGITQWLSRPYFTGVARRIIDARTARRAEPAPMTRPVEPPIDNRAAIDAWIRENAARCPVCTAVIWSYNTSHVNGCPAVRREAVPPPAEPVSKEEM